jgi:hypothetical protein
MIAKRVNKAGKSNFRDLSRYICDVKGKGQKVRDSWATNCADETDIVLAEIEIAATQDLNTRSKIDKTYHLVISLAPGEDLSDAQFREVENFFCEAIGLKDHQRVCAVHTDTSSIHMHLAISKIHPQKLTATEPYYDKFKLQDSCRELEKRFGLIAGISEEKNKSRHQKDAFQNLQSFESYVKDKVLSHLDNLKEKCGSWQELQAELGRFNLEIRERGAGFVISDREKPLYTKASGVDRSLSKQALEKRFGIFEKSLWSGTPDESYRPVPTAKTLASEKLYESYLSEKRETYGKRSHLVSSELDKQKARLDEIKERYALQRLEIKKDNLIAKGRKRLIYQKLSAHMKDEMGNLFEKNKDEIEKARASVPVKPWREWVYEEACRGSEAALGILRYGMKTPQGNGLGEFRGESSDKIFHGLPKQILKDGVILYQLAEGNFLDRGNSIIVQSLDPKVIEMAHRCAVAKFGDSKTLIGSDSFLIEARKVDPKVLSPKEKDLGLSR